MAQVVLGGLGGVIGGGVGRALGAALGGAIDRAVVGSLSPARQRGPRLEALRIQSTAEGSPMACVFGRARVTGQIIWAARFRESKTKTGGGGKGGAKTVDYSHSLSFAVALCEGPVDGIGRVWADGQPMDLTGVTMRLHRGTADQGPDSLIEAVEASLVAGSASGSGGAPAYRGTAYVVFEDLPLGAYGDRVPQLSFEVFRRPEGDGLEERLEGVCLIPGAGEFILATEPVVRREGLTRTRSENAHMGDGRTDLIASLDQLQAQCPNLKRVSLVIGWFGDDLRAAHCQVRPGVENREKATEPLSWSVGGWSRGDAHLVSEVDGRPAYGGTPSDDSVRQAVAALKARGWAVTLYPFVFMDIAAGNALPSPDGGTGQPPHPWRGRMKGRDGANAAADVAAVFGAGLREMALHYAVLAAETGCDGLLIGSEMRGLTWTRDAAGGYPAVPAYRALAADCRAVVGVDVKLSYAADWSEYGGHRPGSGDVVFHLDPLWSDANIDFVGVDWYPPLGDWRAGDGGVDTADFEGPDDPAYLAAQVAGGEGFDWFYASDADRAAQVRRPIVDTAHGEDWVFRIKDLKSWWSSAHHDRPGGVRASSATGWVPGMKPIRLTEFGCAAVDRGGNAPNLFPDPKSSESALPPGSTGAREDRMQRRALEAVLGHFGAAENNPVSAVYGEAMLEGADAWCWDARPYPAFPALADVWADASGWRAGHWLNGRLGSEATHLLEAVLKRGGLSEVDFAVGQADGSVAGYVIDRPMTTREALEPLLTAFDMAGAERDGRVALVGQEAATCEVSLADLVVTDEDCGPRRDRTLDAAPSAARVRFIDEGAGYQTGAVVVRADAATEGGGVDLDLPAVCGPSLAKAIATRLVGEGGSQDILTLRLGPLDALRLEAGDTLTVEGEAGVWRVERIALDETPTAVLRRMTVVAAEAEAGPTMGAAVAEPAGEPFVRVLDLPILPGAEDDRRPVIAAALDPWRPLAVHVGETADTLSERGFVASPAIVGRLETALGAGPTDRWDEVNVIDVSVEGGDLEAATAAGVLGGANLMTVETGVGWELMSWREVTLIGAGRWRLAGLLRGQGGTEAQAEAGATAGAAVVVLDGKPSRFGLAASEIGLDRLIRVGPAGRPPGGAGFAEATMRFDGVANRPWRPTRLRVEASADGRHVDWIPRVRVGGDRWDLEPSEVDGRRFRVRVLDGAVERRAVEVEGASWLYPSAALAADFPGGPGTGVTVAVSHYGPEWGWGPEAVCPLAA